MTDDQKIQEAYKLLRSVRDKVAKLFSVAFNRVNNITVGERIIVENLVKQYEYETVRDAFLEAVAHGTQELAYIRKVCVGLHEKKVLKEEKEKHAEIKKQDTETEFWNPSEDVEWQESVKKLVKSKSIN